ncbi:adenylate kinase [Nonomuraea endophytica]|uniref:Adenylate kinase family enzyme n=1 Tax=Nonomuraea endophytica TaxID=714136 RepID=A0A7W8A8X5_9ACTN|nr:adenylate kinase [Nonomuraea endophytica]MBB5081748.1 adenylate kinase family enzyme [Nonomuraea endophytica]
MRRILVVGISGAGKSTMARALSARFAAPYHEMDALYFNGPGWAVNDDFADQVAEITASPAWIFDSFGYPAVRDLLWERADTVVWLDYRRRVIMPRILRRSLRRTILRESIFGGNRETVMDWFRRDHPAWWAWSQHAARRADIQRRADDPRFAPLRVLRFGTPRSAAEWLNERPAS